MRKKLILIATLCGIPFMLVGTLFYIINVHGQTALRADIQTNQCERVALFDKDKNQPIVGAEDLDIDYVKGRLFISAYNRRTVEKSLKRLKNPIPTGGVYVLPLDKLMAHSGEPISLHSLVRSDDVLGGLRPHGIHYVAQNNELIFINRGLWDGAEVEGQAIGEGRATIKKQIMVPRLERVGANGEVIMGYGREISCNANDVVWINDTVITSFDHQGCQWRAGLEDVLGKKKSGLYNEVSQEVIFDHAGFANGVMSTLTGDIMLAATREKAVHMFTLSHQKPSTGKAANSNPKIQNSFPYHGSISLPGGPDNLTRAHDGAIIAAVHSSLLRMGLHRKLGIGRAPSRIVRIDPDRGKVRVLYDDPSGKLFTAATVGVETKDALILGSVTDAGLLLCRKKSENIL